MFAFFRGHPTWTPSAFSELPEIPDAASPLLRDHCLIAGGLALLLSRCPPQALQRQLPRSHTAYRVLRRQVRAQHAQSLGAHLWNDVAHEIAELADGATRAAVRRCLQRAVAERAARRCAEPTATGAPHCPALPA